MPCFSLDFIEHVLILAVVLLGIIAILKIVVPYAMGAMGVSVGGGGWAVASQVLRIFIIALVVILVIIFAFELIHCLLNLSGGNLLPRR